MLEFVFMLARSDTGAGQPVAALVRTRRATPASGTPTDDEHVFSEDDFFLLFSFF